jgi:hypothetical protein
LVDDRRFLERVPLLVIAISLGHPVIPFAALTLPCSDWAVGWTP